MSLWLRSPRSLMFVLEHRAACAYADRPSQEGVAAMPVVDGQGRLVATLSSGMLRGLRPEHASDLSLPVGEFIKKHSVRYTPAPDRQGP